jgi:acyl-CoA synthetase (AMP-forming)/AMP-acid ligase II
MDDREYLEQLDRLIAEAWPEGFPSEPTYRLGQIPLTEYLRANARDDPDRPAVIYYGFEMTYRELDEASDRLAAFLASRGLVKGDRVGVHLFNCPQFYIAFYGILKLGCIHVPVNPMFQEAEFLYEIEDAAPKILLTTDILYPLVAKTGVRERLEAVVVTRFADFLPEEPALPLPDLLQAPRVECPGALELVDVLREHGPDAPQVAISLDDLATINYTGGTTGMPKGCLHTHWDMVYTGTSIQFSFFDPDSSMTEPDPDQLGLAFAPLFWIAGQLSLIVPVLSGGTVVLLSRWDPTTVLEAIQRYRIAHISGTVDTMVELMEHPEIDRYDLSSLRSTLVSSFVKKLNVEYRHRWKELTGVVMRESSYGMTETHTMDCFTLGMQDDDMDLSSQPVFVGLPVPGTRFKIVDFATRELKPFGEQGEILISTPSLMKGYWNAPEKTAEQIRDGWFATGDIGMIDSHGYLHYLGRSKEMLKVKGMSVFPVEIENLLGRHPAILGSAVLGRPDPERGEVPVAFVQLRPEHAGSVTATELAAWCRDSMAVYKVPEVHLVEEFPLTETGKVQKEVLRDRHADLLRPDAPGGTTHGESS